MSTIYDTNYPLSNPHMKTMLSAFRCNGYVGLVRIIWNIALVAPKKTGDSPMAKILADKEGDRVIFDILLRIPEEVIIALLQNDIGWRFHNDKNFQKLLPPLSARAGIYANVLTCEKRNGRFLSSNEMETYAGLVEKYCQKAPKCSASISIDKKTAAHTWNIDATVAGDRYWLKANNKTWPAEFVQKLRERILVGGSSLEKEQYPKQSPLEIGCAINLEKRIKHHDIEGDLKGSTPAWKVGANILKAMSVSPVWAGFPILYIVDYDREMQLAEIVTTIISGSMCDKGGYNSYPAGTSSKPNSAADYEYSQEKLYIFTNTSHFRKAVDSTLQYMESRHNAMTQSDSLRMNVPDLLHNLPNPFTLDETNAIIGHLGKIWVLRDRIRTYKLSMRVLDHNIGVQEDILEFLSAVEEQLSLNPE